jgi:hypothetical protein
MVSKKKPLPRKSEMSRFPVLQAAAQSAKSSGVTQSPSRGPTSGKTKKWAIAILSALAWMAVGICFSVIIHHCDAEYDRKAAMIERGEATPLTVHVTAKWHEHRASSWSWHVILQTDRKGEIIREDNNVDDLHEGSSLPAYRLGVYESGDGYVVPRFDRHSPPLLVKGCLVAGLLPISVIGVSLLLKRLGATPNPRQLRSVGSAVRRLLRLGRR